MISQNINKDEYLFLPLIFPQGTAACAARPSRRRNDGAWEGNWGNWCHICFLTFVEIGDCARLCVAQ
jgi:hypothetical protein